MNCKVCGSTEYSKQFLAKGTWCGTTKKPEEFFRKSEYDFGWDYYPKEDLRKCTCKCGYEWYEFLKENT